MEELFFRTLRENFVYEYERPLPRKATKEEVAKFVEEMQQLVQRKFPNRSYNLYVESNEDMLSVVVVLDINTFVAIKL